MSFEKCINVFTVTKKRKEKEKLKTEE